LPFLFIEQYTVDMMCNRRVVTQGIH